MNDDSEKPSEFEIRAVGKGILWGMGILVVGAVAQGLISYGSPLSLKTESVLSYSWQGLGCLVGGLMAARRANGKGGLHGALAGLGVILLAAVVMGVSSYLPGLAVLSKMAGIGTVSGAVGGVLGVNSGSK